MERRKAALELGDEAEELGRNKGWLAIAACKGASLVAAQPTALESEAEAPQSLGVFH